MGLSIAPNLALPLEAVTETVAVLGKRGAGKTNTAVVLAEELIAAGQQVVVIDPVDVWWGLKSSADGKREGHPVVVLGGKHGDVPLGATDGATIADFIVDEGTSCVLSLRHFESQADARRFVTDVCSRMYYRKGEVERQSPLHVIIDEASTFVPQRVMAEEARCVAAIQRLVRQGRSSGFGVTLIDQRPATVNKDVLTQIELLVCHRVTSPQDRKALEAWIDQHDSEGQGDTFLDSLAALPQGAAWFWSPGWLSVFKQVQVRARHTFDSSRTPKAGEHVAAPQRMATIDLDTLKGKLSAAIERAKADDPKVLQARIREMERDAAIRASAPVADARLPLLQKALAEFVALRVPDDLEAMRARLVAFRDEVHQWFVDYECALDAIRAFVAPLHLLDLTEVAVAQPREHLFPIDAGRLVARDLSADVARQVDEALTRHAGQRTMSGPQGRMLGALRSFEVIGVNAITRGQLAVFSDQSPRSSGFEKNLSTLRTAGYIDYPMVGVVSLTPSGRKMAPPLVAPASLQSLHAAWRSKLSGPQGRMLDELVRAYPRPMARARLAERTGQSLTSSGWEKNLSTMRALGILDYPDKASAVATDLLFPQGVQ